MASPRFSGDARLRHDGGDPPSRQFAAAKKNETRNHSKNQKIATLPLIRWSIQEVRRIAIRLARKRIHPAHIIAWLLWRRAHQAIAQRAHIKARVPWKGSSKLYSTGTGREIPWTNPPNAAAKPTTRTQTLASIHAGENHVATGNIVASFVLADFDLLQLWDVF